MKKSSIYKFALIPVLLAGIAAAWFYVIILPQPGENLPIATIQDPTFGWRFPASSLATNGTGKNLFDFQFLAYSSIRDPGGIPQGLPVRLKIPVIGVDSAVEDALITPDGRMDVPAGSVHVAWFALGPHPGQVGSAVIGGHFGISNGVKFVFYDLDKLKVGDKAYIEDDEGNTLAFQVRSIKLFARDADATPVFSSSDGLAHLNIITCEGVWNAVNGLYPLRRVVFTDAIPSEGAIVVNPYSPVVVAPVVKPVVITPVVKPVITPIVRPVVKPILPTTAIAPTSTPTSTPPSTSTSTPTSTPTPTETPTVVPTIPPISTLPENPPVSEPAFTRAVQNSFATPVDGLITSILLISIVFTAIKITRP